MKSAVAFTDEIDYLDRACEELASGIKDQLTFGKSSLGIVFCDADVVVEELGRRLHQSLGINIIGATTTASIERNSGYHDMGIVLSVVTGDDVDIAIGCSGELQMERFSEQMQTAYDKAVASLGSAPKFIYLCSPYAADTTSDTYLNALDALSDHTPIFGGVATDHYDLQYAKTFLNGEAFSKCVIFAIFAGNIRPVFAMEHEFCGKTMSKGVVTKATGNQVERVGDRTFLEYLANITPVPDEEVVIFHFQSTPFLMEMPDYEQHEQPVMRALFTVNHETGAGGFLSQMPEGSVLSINILQRENLVGSSEATLSSLYTAMQGNPDYNYSLILVSSCNARHLLMADTKDLETNVLIKKLADVAPDLHVAGYYSFGEICPTAVDAQGKAKNRFHNVSFTACAF